MNSAVQPDGTRVVSFRGLPAVPGRITKMSWLAHDRSHTDQSNGALLVDGYELFGRDGVTMRRPAGLPSAVADEVPAYVALVAPATAEPVLPARRRDIDHTTDAPRGPNTLRTGRACAA